MSIPKIRLQFAEALKRERKKAGLTQEKTAEIIGVSTRFYQMLESKNPTATTLDTLEKLAKVFKITCSRLLDF